MDKLESQSLKESAWRSRLLRHAQSGKSIVAFCRDESVSTASFHIWRAKLAAADGHGAMRKCRTRRAKCSCRVLVIGRILQLSEALQSAWE